MQNIIVISRERNVKVRELNITFTEKIKFNTETKEEIYDRDLEIENTNNLYNLYRFEKKMNSVEDIIKIREKYNLSQSDYSLILGFGKVTIHRYENGMLQTEANDSIISLSKDIKNMKKIVEMNCDKISSECYEELYKKLLHIEENENYKVIKELPLYREIKKFETAKVSEVAKKLLFISEKNDCEITQLTLQKLLYYVQGVSLAIFKKPAFNEAIRNWEYGPVIKEIYDEYSQYNKCVIPSNADIKLSKGLEEVIETVIFNYGQYSAWKLVQMTHEEDPWRNSIKNEIISIESIQNFFEKVYC